MKFFHSIRWRLQVWHGLILVVVLLGIAWPAWDVQRANLSSRIDLDLEQRVILLTRIFDPNRPPRPPPGPFPGQHESHGQRNSPRPNERGLPAPDFDNFNLPEREAELFKGSHNSKFYFALWDWNGTPRSRSENAPENIPAPEETNIEMQFRSRGLIRESIYFYPSGHSMLVGRDTESDYAELRNFAWFLTGAGLVVLILGLLGGWWLSSRAISPISEISKTARRISGGDLSLRIRSSDTDSELGELAGVLNDTFTRLQANFAQQAQFTGDAAHELRTPLTVILTQTQSALARERSTDEYRESLEACQRAAKRMHALTESLLALARLDSEEGNSVRGPFDLSRIVKETVEQFGSAIEQKEIQLEVEVEPVSIHCNPSQIWQVVNNLLSNALYYNKRDGKVRVTVKKKANEAVLVVKDTGQGIHPDDLPHIFERFYRADKSRTHSHGQVGLGLAIVEAIVTGHEGTIRVESDVGQGSQFTIRFPVLAND